MSKQYFVLCGNRVVYPPGHYDLDGAMKTLRGHREEHPRSKIMIVKIISEYGPVKGKQS